MPLSLVTITAIRALGLAFTFWKTIETACIGEIISIFERRNLTKI